MRQSADVSKEAGVHFYLHSYIAVVCLMHHYYTRLLSGEHCWNVSSATDITCITEGSLQLNTSNYFEQRDPQLKRPGDERHDPGEFY